MKTLDRTPQARAHGARRYSLPEAVRGALGGKPGQQDVSDDWAGKVQALQDVIAGARAPAA
ncbi:hypothetical protein L6R53_13875 [Myxococcota bacterium]|nr:hypothetical protein [Myxococcota bacterium]